MTSPTVPDDTAAVRHPEPPRRSDRFFAWVAGLGVVRSDGWIGGIGAGIAARLRIDPLIVRGVLVVATVCGLPLILVYALAWALLPDVAGRIHLRELIRGHFEPAHLGILAGVVVGVMATATPSFFDLIRVIIGGPHYADYGFGRSSPLAVLGFVLGAALILTLLVFIARAARRTPSSVAAQLSVPFDISGDAEATDGRGEDAGSGFASPLANSEPPRPPMPASADSLDEWRAQHAAWKEQNQAWRRQQHDADRSARDRARAERQTAAAAFAAEAADRRRIRKASNPRAGFAFVVTAFGLALITAAGLRLASPEPNTTTTALAMLSAALVLAFSMIIAGVARRRSGFLAFATVGALLAGLITAGAANLGDVRLGNAWASNITQSTVIQPFGTLDVTALPPQGAAESHPISIRKGSGYTQIWVSEGVQLKLTATVGTAAVRWQKWVVDENGGSSHLVEGDFSGTVRDDGRSVYRETVLATDTAIEAGTPTAVTSVPITIDQDAGEIVVVSYVTEEDAE